MGAFLRIQQEAVGNLWLWQTDGIEDAQRRWLLRGFSPET